MKNSNLPRTPEQLSEHYEIEKELAHRLRHASREERGRLYAEVYDELYRRVPHHPQLVRKALPEETSRAVEEQMEFLRVFLRKGLVYLEIGPGDCALAFEVCKTAKRVYAVDVSDEITRASTFPANFELILSDGTSVPVPACSVDLAFSNQLMEHLHPDDGLVQLRNIYEALAPSGRYVCLTPGRITGPHDVSRYYDRIATGLHLKEYTIGELAALFRQVGFSKTRQYLRLKGIYIALPIFCFTVLERIMLVLPYRFRRMLLRFRLLPFLLDIRMVGLK